MKKPNPPKSCTFLCSNGRQRASKWILQLSKHFANKISGSERLGSELTFDYSDYPCATVKAYLDLIHGICMTDVGLALTLSWGLKIYV